MSDGTINCGRKFFDGWGRNNHAVDHYSEKPNCPLAVKLGTITSDGKGDAFSYAEDDMVEDPNLIQHLKHFGINVATSFTDQRSEKTMMELEIDINQRSHEWMSLTESSAKLVPVNGKGLVSATCVT